MSNRFRHISFRRICYLLALTLTLGLVAACQQSEVVASRPVVVQIAGATSMHPVLDDLAAAFTQQHPSVLIDIRGGGSALGEARVQNGRSTLAASTLPPEAANPEPQRIPDGTAVGATNPNPPASAETAGPPVATAAPTARPMPLTRAPIGVDAIAVIVHAGNPATAFTAVQLRDIFSGRILDWAEVGGEEGEILLVSREDGSGTRRAFESRIMGDRDVNLTAVVMPTSADVIEYVAKNPQAIGYVSTAHLSQPGQDQPAVGAGETAADGDAPATNSGAEFAEAATDVIAAALDGVTPSDETVRDQSYSLIQPVYLVTRGPAQGWARQFIDFALSPAGQAIVDRYHTPVR